MKGPGRHHADVGRHLGCLGRRSGRGKSYACSAQNSIGPTQLTWPGTADLDCRQTRPPGRPDVAALNSQIRKCRILEYRERAKSAAWCEQRHQSLRCYRRRSRRCAGLARSLTLSLTLSLTVRPHGPPSLPSFTAGTPVRRCLRRGRARRGAVQSADLPGRSAPTGPSSDARARPANAAESVGSAPE